VELGGSAAEHCATTPLCFAELNAPSRMGSNKAAHLFMSGGRNVTDRRDTGDAGDGWDAGDERDAGGGN
jgi:hypothetical protein